MKILYISSLIGLKNSSASIRNMGYINGIAKHIGKENIDILTIKWPEKLCEEKLIENTKYNIIYKDFVPFIETYFEGGLRGKISINSKKSHIFNLLKKSIGNLVIFPGLDKGWIKSYSDLSYEEYDYIISSSDTKVSHLIAYEIKRKNPNINWVQIWGDPWYTDINVYGINKIRAKWKEKKLLRYANQIFYVSEPTFNEMQKIYFKYKEKMYYIPRGYSISVHESIKSKTHEKYRLIYTGILNKNRNIENLLKAIKRFNEENDKKIILEIYGSFGLENVALAEKYQQCISLNKSKDYFEIIEIYKQADFLLYVANQGNTTQIPGKLFDYMGTTKPILGVIDNITNPTYNFLKNIDRLELSLDNLEELYSSLKNLVKGFNEKRFIPEREYSSEYIMKQMLDIITGKGR